MMPHSPGIAFMLRRSGRLARLIGLLLLAACAPATLPTPPAYPVYTPTPTVVVTPVPLALTPIASPEPLPGLPPLVNAQSSRSLAAHDELLVTVNSLSGSITLVDLPSRAVVAEIPVGDDPRAVALTPDGATALVTLRGESALALVNLAAQTVDTLPVGHMPYGVVTDGRRAFVSSFGTDEIIVLDLASGEALYRVAVYDAPTGLALSGSGEWLLVTHFYSGFVTALNVQRTPFALGAVDAEPDGNLARAIIVAPDGRRAVIPQTRTGLALISLQYQQDWFPVVSALDLATLSGDRAARLTVSMINGPANMPFDAAFSPDGAALYVALAGSDAVEVIDTATQTALARVPVGANPRGVVYAGESVYALNALDGTLTVIDAATYGVLDTIPVTGIPLDSTLLRGARLFHLAADPRLSDGAISCATCHFDGGADGRTWINFRSGPRNTPALGGSDQPPYHWAGDMAELHDSIEDQIRAVMLGDGLIDGPFDATVDQIDAGRSDDLDALVAYVRSFDPWPSPHRLPDGTLTEAAQRGMQLFMSGSPGCNCHTPPAYTDFAQHNLAGAAFSLEVFEAFDTPTLRGLWATAPYMHDGVARDLVELFSRGDPVHNIAGGLTDQQLQDLIAFLLSL